MSDWKQSAARRRDQRHDTTEQRPVGGSKKDTKRWCRGKVGVEHKTVCGDYAVVKLAGRPALPGLYKDWKILVCTDCGKELDVYYPVTMLGDPREPPAWAKAG